MSRRVLSWIMNPKSRGDDSIILCYSHSLHFLVRDRYVRGKRAKTDSCIHCAEFSGNDYAISSREDINRPMSLGSRMLMACDAFGRAENLEKQALEWRNLAYKIIEIAGKERNK